MNNKGINGVIVNVLRRTGSGTEFLFLQLSFGEYKKQLWHYPIAGSQQESRYQRASNKAFQQRHASSSRHPEVQGYPLTQKRHLVHQNAMVRQQGKFKHVRFVGNGQQRHTSFFRCATGFRLVAGLTSGNDVFPHIKQIALRIENLDTRVFAVGEI